MLTIRLTKISDLRHRVSFIREDRTYETIELETRDFLLHDLLHFAVESEAHLSRAFYGSISAGRRYYDLARPQALVGELLLTERLVGALISAAKGRAAAADSVAGLKNLLDAHGEPMPDWITVDFAERAIERLRRLQGLWKATPYGQTMELTFEP